MTLRASGHSARGALRRSAVPASQAMSPCRPSARNWSRSSPAPATASAEANRIASKPSALAASAMVCFSVSIIGSVIPGQAGTQGNLLGVCTLDTAFAGMTNQNSKIEVGIGPCRGEARDAIQQQRPERWPRLEQRIPVLRRLVLLPGYLAEIIERREMRRRGEIGKADGVAREPAPGLGEMADIAQMITQILVPGPHRLHVGRGALRAETPEHLLVDEIGRDLLVELAVEPIGEPSCLGSRRRLARERLEQPGIALIGGIAQIFGNGISAYHRAML